MASTNTQSSYPSLNPYQTNANTNGTTTSDVADSTSSMKDSVIGNTQSAYNSIANSSPVQSISQGPVAQKAKEQAAETSSQFSNVANARVTPSQTAATGQPLTHYHSMFYNILSWENPRVTAIAFASIVTLIFFTRYVPVLKYTLKATYSIIGIIAAAELTGKLAFDKGFASQMRPRKYYTLPRESLEAALEDVEQLVNFFIIEFQRIIFAENVYATVAAFISALSTYFLVKFVPTWGIGLIATTTVFFLPLVYIQNRELIDSHLDNAGTIINQQATQVRDLAAQHTGRAGEVAKSSLSQYSAKASDLIEQAKSKAGYAGNETATNGVTKEDFPAAPTSTPATSTGISTDPTGGVSANVNAGPAERAPEPLIAH